MKDKSLRVLMVDDSEDDALIVIRELKKGGYNPAYKRVETAAALKKAIKEKQWDIILCDYKMPKFNAPSAIALLKESNIDIPLIVVTGKIGEETAAECMRSGAKDYIMKGNLSRLCPAIARELEDAEVRNKQNQMDEKLRREEQRFQAIVEHSLDIIVIMTLEGIVAYINPAIERVLGYKVEERIGASTLEVIHPDDLQYLADKVGLLFTDTNAPVVQFEVRLRHKDGSWRKFEAVGSNLTRNNVVEAVIVNYRDITERKQAVDDLRESEIKYRTLIETTDTGYVIIDQDGLVRDANSEYIRLTGHHALSEIVGRSVMEWTAESEKEKNAEAVNACFNKGSIRNLEIDYVDAKGKITPIEINATSIKIEGKTHTITICRDITERRRAEEDIKENERQYRLLTEKMSDIAWIADMNLKTTYISPSIKNILGFSQEERLRLTLEQQLTPHSLSLVLEALSRELALEEEGNVDPDRTLKMELEYYHKDGSTRWMDLVVSGIRNDQGVLSAIHGVSRDISERKKAEELLRVSEHNYKSLIENIPDIIFTIDLEGKITFISKRTKDIIGYENSEMIKMSIFDLIPQEAHQSTIEKLQKGMKGQKIKYLKMPVKAKSGEILFFEFSFTRIFKDGVVVGAQGTAVDITERKRTEEKLQKEEQRFRILAEQSSDIILLINREKEIIYENPAVDRILGLKRDDRIGKNVLENLHPDDLHRVLNVFDALIGDKNSSSPRDEEIRVRHADGSWRTFEVVASNLTNENVVEAMIINLRDITERKQAEEKLQQTLESLRKAVGTTIQVLVSAVESRDTYTAGHQSRAADLACAIATEMGLAPEKIEGIHMAGIIHDIGKLSIPAEILSKPTKLTEIEFALIKEHSRNGYEMLKEVESPWPLAEIVYQHHERMNGSGYPRKLKGDEIIIESQILAVADVVEAMASHRPYRPTLGIEAALEEITKNKGILYNSAIADACLRLFREKGYQLT